MTERTCSVDDCEKQVIARGWCSTHYARWRRNGTVEDRAPRVVFACVAPGCIKVAKTRGWCVSHYSRWLRHGTVDDPQPKPKEVCAVRGCGRLAKTRGWCGKHYLRVLRHGSPDDPRRRTPDGLCEVDGCDRVVSAWRMCSTHNYRLKTFGSLEVPGSNPSFGTKWCHGCECYLALYEFYEGKGSAGRMSPCKSCRAGRDKIRRKQNPPRTRPDRNRRRRALLQNARSERYTAVEIAERDGWKCQICGGRIGQRFKFPHPRSLSIDHIVPLSQEGDDVKSNVQAAHLRCNTAKNNRGSDQLRLIG